MSGFHSALMIHGAGGGGWEWNLWRDVFAAAGVAVSAPDLLPAQGGLAATRFDDYQQQMQDALTALPRPRVLVGASLGGLLALRLGGLADALVLVNPLPPAPWHAGLAAREWPEVVPWRREARLASSQRALPEAEAATVLFAFRRWRDESGQALRAAYGGIDVERPACPVLFVLSREDEDVPVSLARALATQWDASVLRTASACHMGPLLGPHAPGIAGQAVAWLNGSGDVG